MKKQNINKLRCPITGTALKINKETKVSGSEIINGTLKNEHGDIFSIKNGIPELIDYEKIQGTAQFARDYYAGIAKTYDENVDITFKLYNEDESDIRNRMIDLLALKEDQQVLEISAGTGKDSEIIANRLSEKGQLFCLDISPHMLEYARNRISNSKPDTEIICADAIKLPFADNSFDALFCFAGVGHFTNVKSALSEMARVVKTGGKVVFSEKNVPPWLKETTYGKICINNNPMFDEDAPLKYIPVEARDLCIRWINGNVHYVVDYIVGEGEPKGNFDLELPGARGGTFNTRYYGKLEGVSPETKELAQKARAKLGVSMHKWLDELIKKEAEKILKQKR